MKLDQGYETPIITNEMSDEETTVIILQRVFNFMAMSNTIMSEETIRRIIGDDAHAMLSAEAVAKHLEGVSGEGITDFISQELKERCFEHTVPEKCDVCGHKTSVLDHGTGEYAEKMVCGLCEDRNFREQLLRVEIVELKEMMELTREKRQEMIDAVTALLESFPIKWDTPEATALLDAMEAQGCNVDKFRG